MKEPNTLPLVPAASVAELDHAAEIWTAAQDVMVARGFARRLWGTFPAAQHEFVVLMLRAEQAASTTAQPESSFLYPLFEHMQREHGLTLADSELEEICHVCRQLETTAEEQAADRQNTELPQ